MGRWARTGLRAIVAALVGLGVLCGSAAGSVPPGQPAAIQATEGTQFSGVVDTVSCPNGPPSVRTPMIDWGDGSAASQGTAVTVVSFSATSCTISGSHTYAEEGSHATTITYDGGATDTGSATVGDAPLALTGASGLTGAAGAAVSGTVATFSDPAVEPASSYTATIDWGDGSPQGSGAIGAGDTVSGSHTYTYGGTYQITVTVHDEGGATSSAGSVATVSGCPSAAPSAAAAAFTPPGSGLDARYVDAVFHDLLGRQPGASELSVFVAALSDGASRYDVALSILHSGEYREDLAGGLYSALVGQTPDPATVAALTAQLQAGASYQLLSSTILGSGAFFSGPGGGSNDEFLRALYCTALFRPVDPSAQLTYDSALASGTSRSAVASSLVSSTEYLDQRVESYFLRFLRRSVDPAGLAYYVNLLRSGASEELVVASLVSSPEYYALFNHALETIVTVSRLGVLHITLPQPARLTLTVLRVLRAAHDAAVTPGAAPLTRRIGVVSFGVRRRGHVTLRWNRRVGRRRLAPGNYVLVLRAYRGRRLILNSDALPFNIR